MNADNERKARRLPFSILPDAIITSGLSPRAIVLYAHLDAHTAGPKKYARRGERFIARALGWQPRTVGRCAEELARFALIEIERGTEHGQYAYRVVANPARKDMPFRLPLPESKTTARSRSGAGEPFSAPIPSACNAPADSRPAHPPSGPVARFSRHAPTSTRSGKYVSGWFVSGWFREW